MVEMDCAGIPTHIAFVQGDKSKDFKTNSVIRRSFLGRCLAFFRGAEPIGIYSGQQSSQRELKMLNDMKKQEQVGRLRQNLTELLQKVEDEQLLMHLIESVESWEDLDTPWMVGEPEQQALQTKIDRSMQELEEGMYVSHAEAVERMRSWVDLDQ